MPSPDSIIRDETFDLAFRFATETNEHIFLTGKAGTGKTTFLKYLIKNSSKNIVVAAPTGVAAINAGGVTLHSLFQLPLHPFLPNPVSRNELLARLRYSKNRLDTIQKMDMLVIDEVSMVRGDVIDAIDEILRSVRKNHNELFGGVQVLFIGDLFQLPPVAVRHEWGVLSDYYNSPFFFDAYCLREAMPVFIELSNVYRQSDRGFIELLNKIRNNAMDEESFEMLNERYHPNFKPAIEEGYITLTSHNAQADAINERELNRLFGEEFSFDAEVDGDFPENSFPAESRIRLKRGAQVMFLKNDTMGRYFNGKIGVVDFLSDDEIVVKADGELIEVTRDTWENIRYELDKKEGKLKQEVMGSFTQFPLRLAWATTIHKSQGLTFDKVMIDAARAFAGGQVYVALSRCTALEGIVLLSKIPPKAIACNAHVVEMHQRFSGNNLHDRFEGARTAFLMSIFSDIFSFEKVQEALRKLNTSVFRYMSALSGEPAQWSNDLAERIVYDSETGNKFLQQINFFLSDNGRVETNAPLQKRITQAAIHFDKRIFDAIQMVASPSLETESKEVAKEINTQLAELYNTLQDVYNSIQYCFNDFVLQDYLRHKFDFKIPAKRINIYASSRSVTYSADDELVKRLKVWRNGICNKYNLPVYMVANQESLTMIADRKPATDDELREIKGFGKVKVQKYGREILAIVQEYLEENNLR
ncbi:MAG: AAA family ATPase [Chitinophagaceae bacterium]|nr:AAA family ATPase [Chitinophagaceae bacterium]